jgi:hypothetical protein
MGVVGTDIDAVMAAGFLEAYPDVRLHLLQEMPEMQ